MKLIGIKKAVGNYNRQNGTARIYLNIKSGEIWTNEYSDGNSWTDYHNPNILNILSKGTRISSGNETTSMIDLQEIADAAIRRDNQERAYYAKIEADYEKSQAN